MPAGTVSTAASAAFVGMGQIALASAPDRLSSVVGSCIAVCVHQPRLRVAALAHVVLPCSNGHEGPAGKFADTAVPAMLKELERLTGVRTGYVAKIAGGANMFGSSGPMQIGTANAEAVKIALSQAGVTLAAEHLGGSKGRRVALYPASGLLVVEFPGGPPIEL